MPTIAPYGSWKSPITPQLATKSASNTQQMGFVKVHQGRVTWVEPRPEEDGRMVLVGTRPGETPIDITPPGFNVRSGVHEYGGAPYWLDGDTVYFVNGADQRIYRIHGSDAPEPVTPEPETPRAIRYADGVIVPGGKWMICVRERHHPKGQPDNELVALRTDGSGEAKTIASAHDFYSNPRISPDGKSLAYLCWDHPNMPWDGTEMVVAALGKECSLTDPRTIAGGRDISIFQPQWSPEGKLTYSSDHEGAWTLYQSVDGRQKRLIADGTSVGGPAWMFGYSVYTFLSGGRIGCVTMNQGREQLAILSTDGSLTPIPLDFKTFFYPALTSDGEDTLYFTAGGPTQSSVIAGYNTRTGELSILRETMSLPFDHAYLSEPKHITFPTTQGDMAHALYYPPSNPDFEAPPGELPPLLVQSHGGPTASAPKYLKLLYQYWTSRGFAIMDVDYRGSTGYGRAYWKKLYGQWGVIDVEDCVEAAKYAAANGLADPDRTAISGGSAGGYITLCALAFHDVFQAGSSWYGIGDLETLVGDFHKFESHYCDMLAANTYPAPKELLYARSPIHFLDKLNAPMILLQGKDDTVVPPDQAEDMAKALDARGLPYALLMFEGEGHGFRKAETLRRCMEAETYFFSQVFGFTPADPVEPVEIHNLPAQ